MILGQVCKSLFLVLLMLSFRVDNTEMSCFMEL